MSMNWSGLRGKRLDFSFFKGGGRMEYLVAGVLGIVIIGAAYMSIRQFFGGGSVDAPDKIAYKCEKCGYEFTKKLSEIPQARNPGEMINSMRLDCPSCKAQKSCWRSTECPNCHKLFIAASTRAEYERFARGRGGPDSGHDICPYCKTDLQEWWRAHPRN